MRAGIAIGLMLTGSCDRVFDIEVQPPVDAPPDAPPDAPRDEVVTVASGMDDAMQDPNFMLVDHRWVSLYSTSHRGALRFDLPGLAAGAQIDAAHLEVYVDSLEEDSPDVVITSEASADPAPLALLDINSRTQGTARVTWGETDIGEAWRRSPSIASVLQERVDDPMWQPTSAVLIILENASGSLFEFRQVEYGSGYAARLILRYTNPGT